MVGVATAERVKPSGGAREGDMLVVTKGVAIEATAIVAAERKDEVRREFGEDFQRRAAAFLTDPGISVVEEARVAAGLLEVHALHDVTEGGIATAVREMADAAELGAVLAEAEIPRFYESKRLLAHFGLDILGGDRFGRPPHRLRGAGDRGIAGPPPGGGNPRLRHRPFPPPLLRDPACAGIGAPGLAGVRRGRAHPARLNDDRGRERPPRLECTRCRVPAPAAPTRSDWR